MEATFSSGQLDRVAAERKSSSWYADHQNSGHHKIDPPKIVAKTAIGGRMVWQLALE